MGGRQTTFRSDDRRAQPYRTWLVTRHLCRPSGSFHQEHLCSKASAVGYGRLPFVARINTNHRKAKSHTPGLRRVMGLDISYERATKNSPPKLGGEVCTAGADGGG